MSGDLLEGLTGLCMYLNTYGWDFWQRKDMGSTKENYCLSPLREVLSQAPQRSLPPLKGALGMCISWSTKNAVTWTMFWSREAPKVFIGNWSHRSHFLPFLYQNRGLKEGKKVFGINDVVHTNSRHHEPYQSGNGGKSKFPVAKTKGQPCTQTLLKVTASVLPW